MNEHVHACNSNVSKRPLKFSFSFRGNVGKLEANDRDQDTRAFLFSLMLVFPTYNTFAADEFESILAKV